MRYGHDLLMSTEISPTSFRSALEKDLGKLKRTKRLSKRAESAQRIVDQLTLSLQYLAVEGKFNELAEYEDMLLELLGRFPRLTRIIDLTVEKRVGCKLNMLLFQLMQYKRMVSSRILDSLFESSNKNYREFTAIMDSLEAAGEWIKTRELLQEVQKRAPEITEPRLHQLLHSLIERALVMRNAWEEKHTHRLSPVGQTYWRDRTKDREKQ